MIYKEDMLAHHPSTGKPIRILRTAVQLDEAYKTLLWLRSTMKGNRWINRWNIVASEVSVASSSKPDVIIVPSEDSFDTWRTVLQTLCTDDSSVLLCTTSKFAAESESRGFNYDRLFKRTELYDLFPYLGEKLRDDDPIEKCILAFAHILRIRTVVWSSHDQRSELEFGTLAVFDAWKKSIDGSIRRIPVDSDDTCVPKMWLIQQYFKSNTARRTREIQSCLSRNLACDFIDTVLLLNECVYPELASHPKLQTSVIGHRLTYYDVLKTIQEVVPEGDYVIFANSDMYFDTSLSACWRVGMGEKSIFIALLRWEETTGQLFGPRSDSQDAWIVARDTVMRMSISEEVFGFPFGKSGCDNALALAMMQNRCLVANPALTIRSWHVHASNVRTYDPKDILYRTHYLYLDPTYIQTYEIVRDMSKYLCSKDIQEVWKHEGGNPGKSFPRRILGVDDSGLQTVCTMLARKTESIMNFSPHSANMWTGVGTGTPLYNIRGGAFMTSEGLINTWNKILVGNHESWANGWERARQSNIMQSIHVPSLIACELTPESCSSLSMWCLLYLSRVLAIREAVGTPAPEFLVPPLPGINEFLSDCIWKSNITVVPVLENVNYYSENIWAIPSETNGTPCIRREDIARLRSLLPKSTPARKPTAVFCVENDDSLMNSAMCKQISEFVLQNKWEVVCIDEMSTVSERRNAFGAASWIFGRGRNLEWMWYASPGTTIMEFMSDSDPQGINIHLAGACDLRYIVSVVKKEPIEYQRQHALEDIQKAIQMYGFKEMLNIQRSVSTSIEMPRIIVPSGSALKDIWMHSGDTFREMINIWSERDYIKLERSESTGYCWWGGIGEILLYDRPTHRWWNPKQPYQLALFGNCAPPEPDSGRQSIWCFWGRSPRALEVVNMLSLNLHSYKDRAIKSVFLGKIENGVQQAHRTGADWKSAVELFSMPIDPTGAPYPFTQEQYLEKLCNSRYGLCLPGYGPKCNREIEYFACGVVPIVTPGIDMKGYLVPPIENVHYFTARTPEDVRRIVETTRPEQWMRMSIAGRKWWSLYASAEGLFRLTWDRIEQCRPFLTSGGIPKYHTFGSF